MKKIDTSALANVAEAPSRKSPAKRKTSALTKAVEKQSAVKSVIDASFFKVICIDKLDKLIEYKRKVAELKKGKTSVENDTGVARLAFLRQPEVLERGVNTVLKYSALPPEQVRDNILKMLDDSASGGNQKATEKLVSFLIAVGLKTRLNPANHALMLPCIAGLYWGITQADKSVRTVDGLKKWYCVNHPEKTKQVYQVSDEYKKQFLYSHGARYEGADTNPYKLTWATTWGTAGAHVSQVTTMLRVLGLLSGDQKATIHSYEVSPKTLKLFAQLLENSKDEYND